MHVVIKWQATNYKLAGHKQGEHYTKKKYFKLLNFFLQ